MPTRIDDHHNQHRRNQHRVNNDAGATSSCANESFYDKLDRLAYALTSDIPHRIEIRGPQQRISVMTTSSSSSSSSSTTKQQKVEISFATSRRQSLQTNFPHEVLELLSQRPASLPKVLLIELYNDQLGQVLQAISGKVQNLDIANCCVSDDHNGATFHTIHQQQQQQQQSLKFQSLTHLQIFTSKLREHHLHTLISASAQSLQHFSIYLVASGPRSIGAIFRGIPLPRLGSVDLRGCFASHQTCFPKRFFPRLATAVLVETLGSKVHLGHVVGGSALQELVLGKTICAKRDLELWGNALCHAKCQLRRVHLLAIDFVMDSDGDGDDESSRMMDSLLNAIRHNHSLVEIVIGSDLFGASRQDEVRLLLMRNKYLTQGLGRLSDMRLLPQFLSRSCANNNNDNDSAIFGTKAAVSREQIDAVYFMVKERPDLFCRQH